ncbi:hypothetical protein AC579_6117 [Pseudocercospora musae]|uniref:Xylanolytic transcriptional activator regulatory domain-containing protein n=1 Tax=Pseudocercospora musae TaxID=113226 RepID=A0A139IM83_9PEZI|nr:hypothetical protein AC579_6117 [Pseudocercospora musae]
MSKLYEAVNQRQLLEDADSCLLHYGTSYHPDIITNAEGQTITTASGHRMLDWTSGQMTKFYTGKFEIVGLASSWHGVTSGAIAAQYHAGRAGYGPNMPGNLALPTPNAYRSIFRHADGSYDWQTELNYGFELIDKQSCGSLAALILEPILSSGGMLVLPPGYLKAVKRHCEQRGMLLIIDEAQTGIGRAGDMFAFQHFAEDEGVVPDVLTLSKTLGNGLPLSAVVTSNSIADFAKDNNFLFYTTHVNDPLPASVGDKVLEIVMRDKLVERSRRLGQKFQQRLQQIQSRYRCVGDVRGRGLMAGVEIVADRETKVGNTELGAAIASRMTELGLWAQLSTMPSFGGVFRLAPPLTTTDDELEKGLMIIEEAFASTPGTMPLYASSDSSSVSPPVEAGQTSCTFCRDTGRLCEYSDRQDSAHKRRRAEGRSGRENVQRSQGGLAAAITGTSATESGVILEPALAEDVEALEHYLTAYGPEAVSTARPYRTVSTAEDGKPVVYLTVPRRRKGLHNHEINPGVKHREVMENVLGPLRQHVIDLYFDKLHPCFPIVDEETFHDLLHKDPHCISSTLMCDVYASALHFWNTSTHLKHFPRPDLAFMWNQAVAALQEDNLGSTIATVHASLLDLIGRPVLSITGNIVTLGRTVTLAHSLGLHRDPTGWRATDHEKHVRIRLWFGVMIHDHWASLAHGNPPLIQRQNYDVPLPRETLTESTPDPHHESTATFVHLCKLSQILGNLLPFVYTLRPDRDDIPRHIRRLEVELDQWESALPDFVRRSWQFDGTVNGASNLRFCFLSYVYQMLQGMTPPSNSNWGRCLNILSQSQSTLPEEKLYRLAVLRDTASALAEFVISLQPLQLEEFWLPYTAHLLVYATTVLLRCVVDSSDLATKETSAQKLVEMRNRLKTASESGWDLADFCLERCSKPILTIAAAVGISTDVNAVGETRDDANGRDVLLDATISLPPEFFLPLDSLDYTFDALWDISE